MDKLVCIDENGVIVGLVKYLNKNRFVKGIYVKDTKLLSSYNEYEQAQILLMFGDLDPNSTGKRRRAYTGGDGFVNL